MSENPVRRKFSRHIDIRKYFVRELVLSGFLKLVPLRTNKMVADALTKSLPSPAFIGNRQIMTGHTPFTARLLRCMNFIACVFSLDNIFFACLHFFHVYTSLNFLGLPIIYLLKNPLLCMGESDKAPTNKIYRRAPLAWLWPKAPTNEIFSRMREFSFEV